MATSNSESINEPAGIIACVERVNRTLCWFASFPYSAFTQITTPVYRCWIYLRGVAVIISPSAFGMAFIMNGTRIIGSAPYLFLLPPVVFIIDWFLIARSYISTRGSSALVLVRLLITVISALMAGYSGLLTEGASLLLSLHKAENSAIMKSSNAQYLIERMHILGSRISANEEQLAKRQEFEVDMYKYERLHDLECNGASGIDPRTGIRIVGGKCGKIANRYADDVQNDKAQLIILDELKKSNATMEQQRAKLGSKLNDLLNTNRTHNESIGMLVKAMKYANLGIWIHIIGISLVIVLCETLALLSSAVEVPPLLLAAVQRATELDEKRMQIRHESELGQITKERVQRRADVADGLAPLEVHVGPMMHKSSEDSGGSWAVLPSNEMEPA